MAQRQRLQANIIVFPRATVIVQASKCSPCLYLLKQIAIQGSSGSSRLVFSLTVLVRLSEWLGLLLTLQETGIVLCFLKIHVLLNEGQHLTSQSHIFWCFLFKVDKQVTKRFGCAILKSFLNIFNVVGIHLFCQMGDLSRISRIFENYHIMGV